MTAGPLELSPSPCARIVLAVFGFLFLIALLSVPVTTKTSQLRQDPNSNVVFKTTYPRNSTMFLPHYVSARARSTDNGDLRVRSAQWIGTMAIVVILGLFDHAVFCRLLKRTRRRESGPGPGAPSEGSGHDSPASGFSLFP